MRLASWVAGILRARTTARRIRRLTEGIPSAAYLVTGVIWVIELRDGLFYPLFDSANLANSWGGPSLAGAWAVHLALGTALLLIVSLPFALWRPPPATSPHSPGAS